MPTYIHLVRHAQGFHNLCNENHQLPDPLLTPLGEEQCAALCASFPDHDKITHLVASPMRRTIYTCLLSFAPAVAAGKTLIALPEVQEVSNLPCDVGSTPAALAAEFGPESGYKVDLSRVPEDWTDKARAGSPWAPDLGMLEARAKKARRWLRELAREGEKEGKGEDVHIALVSHGGFLHFLTQDFDGMNPMTGTGWKNTEYGTYEFADPSGEDEEARLKETRQSWRRRRGSAMGLTETEQRELRAVFGKMLAEEFGNLGAVPEEAVEEEK